jgi:hypothetical protein
MKSNLFRISSTVALPGGQRQTWKGRSMPRKLTLVLLGLWGVGVLAAFAWLSSQVASASSAVIPAQDNSPAAPYVVMVTFGPCTITIQSATDTVQAKADVDKIKTTLEQLLSKSADMQTKVTEACTDNGNGITINVVRDDPRHTIGSWRRLPPPRVMTLDVGDIEVMKAHISGNAADVDLLSDSLLADVIAHEFDHARGPTHNDPADSVSKGPAVEDANKVLSQMGITSTRTHYGDRTNGLITYSVNGNATVINVLSLVMSRTAEGKFGEPSDNDVDDELFFLIPDHPCVPPENSGCWPKPSIGDDDLDGIPDGSDNALDLPNPQQADTNQNGIGQGLDTDDDSDGWQAPLEPGLGSSDMDAASTPENYAVGNTCNDGVDNDNDGHMNVFDASCVPPAYDALALPQMTALGQTFPNYRRPDLGGVLDGYDVLAVTLVMTMDYDLDSAPDEVVTLRGPLVILRSNVDGGIMPAVFDSLTLTGTSSTYGPLTMLRNLVSPATGAIIPDASPSTDFPAAASFDMLFELHQTSTVWTNSSDMSFNGPIPRYPFYDATIPMDTGGGPVPLYDEGLNHVADVLDAVLIGGSPPPIPVIRKVYYPAVFR